MDKPISIAIVGCGHIGGPALRAVQLAPDMVLAGVIDLDCRLAEVQRLYPGIPVATELEGLPEKPDAAILAVPSRAAEQVASSILSQGVCTVDCFDMHGDPFMHLRSSLDPIARQHHTTAILSSGVDPGVSTMVRALFEIWAPTGLTYVRYGPGMSMGHTVAARSYPGVRDALSITRPGDPGCHKRELYLELEEGADFDTVKSQVLQDPYFAHDDVRIIRVDDVTPLVDVGHRIEVFRKGGSSGVDNQLLEFQTTFNNPASTAQIMVAAARAAQRMPPGAYTMLEIPLLHFLPGPVEALLERLV